MIRLADELEQTALRLLTDALNEATRAYWLRRAETFEAARPRPGEFHGRATRADLSARWQRLTAIAQACRARAELAPLEAAPDPDVLSVWQEAAA